MTKERHSLVVSKISNYNIEYVLLVQLTLVLLSLCAVTKNFCIYICLTLPMIPPQLVTAVYDVFEVVDNQYNTHPLPPRPPSPTPEGEQGLLHCR